MRTDKIDHLGWVRTVVHQIAKHPQLVVWFRENRSQRFKVGVDVGNDEKFHSVPSVTADCGDPVFPVFSNQAVEFAKPPLPSGQ
jgi:hypothetical protein